MHVLHHRHNLLGRRLGHRKHAFLDALQKGRMQFWGQIHGLD
jgi:hypothetical protein